MPPVSAACFAHCNHRLVGLIGQKSWDILRDEQLEEKRHTVISMLALDDPRHFARNICHKLHLCSRVQWPNTRPMTYQPYACPKKPEHIWPKNSLYQRDSLDYSIHFTHVQLAVEGKLPVQAFRHTEIDII
jgi:hypothetical protein